MVGLLYPIEWGLDRIAKMNETPWWTALPQDFSRNPYQTSIDSRYAFKIKAAAAVDILMRTGLASMVTLAITANLASRKKLERDLELVKFYKSYADRADIDEVFPRPPKHVEVTPLKPRLFGYKPKGVHFELLGFQSPYVALHPAMREAYARHDYSHEVVAQYWRHPDGARPTLIFLHGYFADSFWFNSTMFSLRWFYKKGYDILLYTMPFHGYRSDRFDLFSGIGIVAHGLSHMNEVFLQTVYDLRIWIDYLQQQGAPAIGVSGLSLGGYISALMASVDDRLAFAIPNAPAVMLVDTALMLQPLNWILYQQMARFNIDVSEFRHVTAVHCPLTWQPVISPGRLLVIGGAGDRFTLPQFVQKLHEHWSGSQIHWFPGNHAMHLHQGEYLRLMRRFMDRCCAEPCSRK